MVQNHQREGGVLVKMVQNHQREGGVLVKMVQNHQREGVSQDQRWYKITRGRGGFLKS